MEVINLWPECGRQYLDPLHLGVVEDLLVLVEAGNRQHNSSQHATENFDQLGGTVGDHQPLRWLVHHRGQQNLQGCVTDRVMDQCVSELSHQRFHEGRRREVGVVQQAVIHDIVTPVAAMHVSQNVQPVVNGAEQIFGRDQVAAVIDLIPAKIPAVEAVDGETSTLHALSQNSLVVLAVAAACDEVLQKRDKLRLQIRFAQ